MSHWHEKVAIVTGGSAGLGRSLAIRLAASGARVVLAARDEAHLREVTTELTASGAKAIGISTDVTDDAQVKSLIDGTLSEYGRIDALFNNAGRSMRGRALETSVEDFADLMELNFLSCVRCTNAAAPHLIEARGHVVNVGSLASKAASRFLGAYPASKAPLVTYTQQLRFELGPRGVHALLVCPGPIARSDAGTRYDMQTEELPDSARQAGGGVRMSGIQPEWLAGMILKACERRAAELVVPRRAKLLFALSQLSPRLGDWIIDRMTS